MLNCVHQGSWSTIMILLPNCMRLNDICTEVINLINLFYNSLDKVEAAYD